MNMQAKAWCETLSDPLEVDGLVGVAAYENMPIEMTDSAAMTPFLTLTMRKNPAIPVILDFSYSLTSEPRHSAYLSVVFG